MFYRKESCDGREGIADLFAENVFNVYDTVDWNYLNTFSTNSQNT